MKTTRLSARGGSALGGKKLILCMTIAIAVVVFLYAEAAFANTRTYSQNLGGGPGNETITLTDVSTGGGTLTVYDGATLLWTHTFPTTEYVVGSNCYFCDLDGDGNFEFWIDPTYYVSTSNRRRIYFFDYNKKSSSQAYQWMLDMQGANTTLSYDDIYHDIDGDGCDELIFIHGQALYNSTIADYPQKVFVFDYSAPKWSYTLGYENNTSHDNYYIMDLDKNGTDEIIFFNWAPNSTNPGCTRLYVLNSDGTLRWGGYWSASQVTLQNSLAFADLDNDGKLEIVALAKYDTTTDVYRMYAWNDNSATPYITQTLSSSATNPTIYDIDNDWKLDIVSGGLSVYENTVSTTNQRPWTSSTQSEYPSCSISGYVKYDTGAPISGAKIFLISNGSTCPISATTGVDGSYEFADVYNAATYGLDMYLAGHRDIFKTVSTAGSDVVVDFTVPYNEDPLADDYSLGYIGRGYGTDTLTALIDNGEVISAADKTDVTYSTTSGTWLPANTKTNNLTLNVAAKHIHTVDKSEYSVFRVVYRVYNNTKVEVKTQTFGDLNRYGTIPAGGTGDDEIGDEQLSRIDTFRRVSNTCISINGQPQTIAIGGSYPVATVHWLLESNGFGDSWIKVINTNSTYFEIEQYVYECDEEYNTAYAEINSYIKPSTDELMVCSLNQLTRQYGDSGGFVTVVENGQVSDGADKTGVTYSTTKGSWLPSGTATGSLQLNVYGKHITAVGVDKNGNSGFKVVYRVYDNAKVEVKTKTYCDYNRYGTIPAGGGADDEIGDVVLNRIDTFQRASPTSILVNGAAVSIALGGSYIVAGVETDVPPGWYLYDNGWGKSYIKVTNTGSAYFDVEQYTYECDEEYDTGYAEIESYIKPLILPNWGMTGHVKYYEGAPIAGAVVTAHDNVTGNMVVSAATGADGSYIIQPVQGGHDYTLSATYLDYVFDPPTYFFGNNGDGVDINTYTIDGFVTRYGGTGLNGINVNIKKGDTVVRTVTTGNHPTLGTPGYYKGVGLGPGAYTVQAANP